MDEPSLSWLQDVVVGYGRCNNASSSPMTWKAGGRCTMRLPALHVSGVSTVSKQANLNEYQFSRRLHSRL